MLRLMRACLLTGILSIFIFSNFAGANDAVTANLRAVPMSASPGSKIKFQATIYNNPNFYANPDEMIQILVTRNNFSWISEKRNIKYPGTEVFTINFTNQFTIPADAKAGEVFNFVLTNKIWWPMSQQVTVKVTGVQIRKKNLYKKIDKIPPFQKREVIKEQ